MSASRLEISYVRQGHTYVFRYAPKLKIELLRHLGKLAADPRLEFNWFDCGVVAGKIRFGTNASDLPVDQPGE